MDNIKALKSWCNRKAKYGNISLVKKDVFSNINFYFSPFCANSNHSNAVITTFKLNDISFIWCNLHLSTCDIQQKQLEIIKKNMETIQTNYENINYLDNRTNTDIIFSGDFNTNSAQHIIHKVFNKNKFKSINDNYPTFCFKKNTGFALDHIIYTYKNIKISDIKIGNEFKTFKCCSNPDIGPPPKNATCNSGVKVICNQKKQELSDHKLVYSNFELLSKVEKKEVTIKKIRLSQKNDIMNLFIDLNESSDKEYLKKGFCILFIHGSFNPLHNDHLDGIVKVKKLIQNNSNINNDCFNKNIIGLMVPTSENLLSYKKDLNTAEFPNFSGKDVRFTKNERLDMLNLAILDYNWLYYTDISMKPEFQGTIPFKNHLLKIFKEIEKKKKVKIPITLIQIFGEDYALKSPDPEKNKRWRETLSKKGNDAKLFVKRTVKDGEESYEDFYFKNITSNISSTKIRKALHNSPNNKSENLQYLQESLHPRVLKYLEVNKNTLLNNTIKVFNEIKDKENVSKKKIILNKKEKMINTKKKKTKTCKEVSLTRCSPYNGPMMQNCILSEKNRCVRKK